MKYKNLDDFVLTMAACHGIFSRYTSADRILQLAASAYAADGVYTEDVKKLDEWLGTLTEDQKLILADGEEEEMSSLVADSPTSETSCVCVGQLIEDIYQAISERT